MSIFTINVVLDIYFILLLTVVGVGTFGIITIVLSALLVLFTVLNK